MKLPFFIGRLIYGGFFLYNGINHFRNVDQLSGYAAAKGVPFPKVAVTVSGAVLTLAGTSIILGLKPKGGVLGAAGFLASAAALTHDFWRAQDAAQRENEMINFTKNLALLGAGLGMLGVKEPWPVSLEKKPALPDRLKDTARRLAA